MPNWKSYESSVRLLSAILAAHPELKLNYGAIADKYGEDTTAKAVSTRFERLKKEPAFNLANSLAEANGTGASNSAPKPKSTPRKRKNTGNTGNSNEDDEEDFEEKISPKKSMLNKTQGGRVSKPETPHKKGNGSSNGVIPLDITDDEGAIIKPEPEMNGYNHHSNGNGNSFVMADVDADDEAAAFYEPGYASESDMV